LSLTTWGDKCWIERATLYDPEKLFSLAKLEGRLHRVETEREILTAWALNLGFEVRISNRMENLVSLGIVDDKFATEFMRRINDNNQQQYYLNSGIVTGNQECDTYLATVRKKHDRWLRRYLVN
jgi:hypothetical protein